MINQILSLKKTLIFLLPFIALTAAAKPMSNEDVLDLVNAGIDEETIIVMIETNDESKFDTSSDAVISLSKKGVSKPLIQAMLKAGKPRYSKSSKGLKQTTASLQDISPPKIQVTIGGEYYTRVNFWYEKGRHITTNYSVGTRVPINTKIRITKMKKKRIYFVMVESGTELTFENIQGYTLRSTPEMAAVLLSSEKTPVEKLGEQIAKFIKQGQLRLGMTKNQVIMTRGFPPQHRTSSLENDTWIYWQNKFATHTLLFEDGILTEGRDLN